MYLQYWCVVTIYIADVSINYQSNAYCHHNQFETFLSWVLDNQSNMERKCPSGEEMPWGLGNALTTDNWCSTDELSDQCSIVTHRH